MQPFPITGVLCFALVAQVSLTFDANAQPQRVNLAKYQRCAASSAASGEPALFVTDGVVGNGHCWMSDPTNTGPHWVTITLPLPMEIGSAHLYLGRDDIEPVISFSLQYWTGGAWASVPGATFAGTAATVFNVVFSSPVTASEFRFHTTEPVARVREIALFPPDGAGGYPFGTDVTLNLARKRPVIASSVQRGSHGKRAVDGYVADELGQWASAGGNGPHTLEVDLQESARLGSAHVYLGAEGDQANFKLEYWNGNSWAALPGGTMTGNTNRELRIPFTSPVSASRVRLLFPDSGVQRVRELVLFAAAAGVKDYPIGTDVTFEPPPATKFDTYGDGFWRIVNRAFPNCLAIGPTGAGQTHPESAEEEDQFQLLYNLDSDTFRLRNRVSGKCLQALNAGRRPGTAVVEGSDYHGMPHELWRFQDTGGGHCRVVNVWNGLALETDGRSPAVVALAPPSSDPRQQWRFDYRMHHPKKGTGGYEGDWAKFNASWNYNWGRETGARLPAGVLFMPMQHNRWWPDWRTLPHASPRWRTEAKSIVMLGYNEPEEPTQGNISMTDAVAFWPNLEQTDLPLASPVPVHPFNGWLEDFYNQAGARGYRVDYTAVHWYANPDAGELIKMLQNVYETWGRPVWLTEFTPVDWGGTAKWTEEDNHRFLSEFMWRAEDLPWLKRYAIFFFNGDPPANPWDRVGPRGNMLHSDGKTLTPYGELYASWDADRTLRPGVPYYIQGLASMHRLQASPSTELPGAGTIRQNDVSAQWTLAPTGARGRHHIVSLRDGRRLSFDGKLLGLAPPGASGASTEWVLNGPDSHGYTSINHPATSRNLRLSRVDNEQGAPTALDYGMQDSALVNDTSRWRFIKPFQPSGTVRPAPVANLAAVGGFGRVSLKWSPPDDARNILRYSVYRRNSAGGGHVLLAGNVGATGYVDTNVVQGATYRYVVQTTDWLGNPSPNSNEAVAISVGPALATSLSSSQIVVNWADSSQKYRVATSTNLDPPMSSSPVSAGVFSNGSWSLVLLVEKSPEALFDLESE